MNPIVVHEPKSGREVVIAHSKTVISTSSEYIFNVDRTSQDNLWLAAIAFYKGAMKKEEKLTKELVVQYNGEVGADSGALRREFFEDALKQGNARLFDGESHNRIPKKDWSFEFLFEIFGTLVSHSILQGGPGFPCLSSATFHYLVSGNPEYCFPEKEDIPLDIGTFSLITFIEKVCQQLHVETL